MDRIFLIQVALINLILISICKVGKADVGDDIVNILEKAAISVLDLENYLKDNLNKYLTEDVLYNWLSKIDLTEVLLYWISEMQLNKIAIMMIEDIDITQVMNKLLMEIDYDQIAHTIVNIINDEEFMNDILDDLDINAILTNLIENLDITQINDEVIYTIYDDLHIEEKITKLQNGQLFNNTIFNDIFKRLTSIGESTIIHQTEAPILKTKTVIPPTEAPILKTKIAIPPTEAPILKTKTGIPPTEAPIKKPKKSAPQTEPTFGKHETTPSSVELYYRIPQTSKLAEPTAGHLFVAELKEAGLPTSGTTVEKVGLIWTILTLIIARMI